MAPMWPSEWDSPGGQRKEMVAMQQRGPSPSLSMIELNSPTVHIFGKRKRNKKPSSMRTQVFHPYS